MSSVFAKIGVSLFSGLLHLLFTDAHISQSVRCKCSYSVNDATTNNEKTQTPAYVGLTTTSRYKLTLVGRGGVGATPRWFSRDCSGAVCDRELKLDKTDARFKLNMIIFLFSGQDRSLTYDVISKPRTVTMLTCNAANNRRSFSGSCSFQKVANPRVLTCCISRISMQVI